MATTIATGYDNAPKKQGEPPDYGFLYTGKGLDFDGATDYIDITETSTMTVFTISAWFKTTSTDGSGINIVSGTNAGYYAMTVRGGILKWYDGSDWRGAITVNDGNWHYGVQVFNAGNHTIYVDGVKDYDNDEGSYSNGTFTTIGHIQGAARYFDGSISNVQIWDAVWSESDVQYAYTHPEKLASNNSGTSLTESNLKLWLPMNEGNPRSPQTTVYDGSGNQNHGTTVFTGDELITNGAFATVSDGETGYDNGDGTVDGWTLDNAVLSINSNRLKVLNNSANYGKGIYQIATEAGKSYTASVDFDRDSSSTIATLNIGDSSGANDLGQIYNTSDQTGTLIKTFIASDTTTFISPTINNTDTHYCYFDNLTVKEIGIATGWTEADQQLDIPQTALMGGSRKMHFDGIDDNVDCGTASIRTAAMTYSAWIKHDGTTGQALSHAITNFRVNFAFDSAVLAVSSLSGSSSNTQHVSGAVVASTWNHYCRVIADSTDGTNAGNKFYINGSLQSGGSGQAVHGTNKLMFGTNTDGSEDFNGLIDDISIYSAAFSLAEVQELYNDGIPLDATAHTQASNLVGYWRNNVLHTDGTWKDLTESDGSGNNGTVTGSPDYAFFQSGLQSGRDSQGMFETHPQEGGGVLTFDGVGDLVAGIGMGDAFGEESLTVSCWFKADDVSGATIQFIWGEALYSAPGTYGFGLGIVSSNLRGAGGNNASTVWDNLAYSISSKTWYHATLVYDKTGGTTNDNFYYLYVDGELRDSFDTDLKPRFSGDYESYIIGCAGDHDATPFYGSFFKGQVDDVMLYNRALGVEEVLKNYNGSKGKHTN